MPHVVAWNLTRRCNLECAHCYIAAGPSETADGELSTEECLRITREILALNPAPFFILSGGEPLLRSDLAEIASFASSRGATVVVGTNGTMLTDARIAELKDAGVTGVAVSIDSLDARHHDNFRHGAGALAATTESLDRLRAHRLDFVIQTTAHRGNKDEIEQIVAWSAEQGAVSFNLYFLVATGRGARLADLTTHDYERLLASVVRWESEYRGRMMVRAKCAPHVMRHAHQAATSPHPHIPTSPFLNYATRCPCGTQYCRITPDGKLTPCPYIPTAAGDLRAQSFGEVWRDAPLFRDMRSPTLGGNCGKCEYRAVCGGCRARALGATGDLFASDPSCEYEPTGLEALIAPRVSTTYGATATQTLPWTPEATARMTRIPSFVRGVVMQRVEDFARRQGRTAVTVELLAEVRSAMPVDFAKRAPFFVRDA